ncbi:unnamed protein product, partial [Mesorhabditis belari]|uniref:Protein root UVB sensitive/RUS domain-containing protein n=1 Tax=Mesorhabditis belari TaxID=2138241 RepID=A0AAF3EU65_9BILA
MIGRILFSYAKGSQLDYDCKKWRLVADILNDAAFFIDLLCPLWPKWFLVSACISSLFRCIVGVAGGATRTTIVQHQARRNNLADVAAKDGSQETLVNAAALLVSLALLPAVSGKHTIIWILFGLLTFLHLFANYRAVRSLKLDVLNGKRAAIIIREYIKNDIILSIDVVNKEEPLFYNLYPTRHLGCSLKTLLEHRRSKNMIYHESPKFTILYDPHYGTSWIAMTENAESIDQLNACYDLEQIIINQKIKLNFNKFVNDLKENGWQIDHHLNFDEWSYSLLE